MFLSDNLIFPESHETANSKIKGFTVVFYFIKFKDYRPKASVREKYSCDFEFQ